MNSQYGLDVLSLFDGMACGRIALDRAGMRVHTYRAFEIDKWAIQIAKKNWPDIMEQGDIENWRSRGVMPVPDVILAGSPCQGFSLSAEAKARGFEDHRSRLFYVFVDILHYYRSINPHVKFLLENVKMKKEWRDRISSLLGVEPVLIDSATVSAQSRPRYYWANWHIDQPEERHISLQSILDSGRAVREKGFCIDANYYKGGIPIERAENGDEWVTFKHQRGRRSMVCTGDWDNPHDYRMLTPREAERAQTVPEDYTAGVSNTQRYHMLGNGWTVDVIAHILRQMPR